MFCSRCGKEISDDSKFCPQCGLPKGEVSTPESKHASGSFPNVELGQNVAGLLAYVTFVPALIFLMVSPYNRYPFVRFHAFQSIFLTLAWFAVHLFFQVAFSFLGFLGLGLLPIQGLIGLAFFIFWIVCLVKAYRNEKYKLPVIGELANQQSAKI